MATPSKVQKGLEIKLHDHLYQNIYLLTLIYPTTEQFKKAFTKEMFLKNNSFAFQHVVYYLLKILNPDIINEKLKSWPPTDKREEVEFRNEVMKYINELNSIYEGPDVPTITSSHLISPGGYKFIKMMFKLSQLVMFRHLQMHSKMKDEMLIPIKPDKNPAITTNRTKVVKKLTEQVNNQTRKLIQEFDERVDWVTKEAALVTANLTEVSACVEDCNLQYNTVKKEYGQNVFDVKKCEDIAYKLLSLLSTKFETCMELVRGFVNMSENLVEPKVPTELSKAIKQGAVRDICSLMEEFQLFLNQVHLSMKPASSNEDEIVQELIEKLTAGNEILRGFNAEYDEIQERLSSLSEDFSAAFNKEWEKSTDKHTDCS